MSFATEPVIGARLLTPRGRIIVIRQVQRAHLCSDLLRFATFFSTAAIYEVAEFRFTKEATTHVLAEISAFRRLSPPGISHIIVVVVFTGDITAIPPGPAIHSNIYRTLRAWAGEVRAAWTDLLARRGDTVVPVHDTDFQLRSSRRSPAIVLLELRPFTPPQLVILVDDLSLDILSRSDEQPGTHVLSRTLEPHLVWSTCTEIDEDNCLYPSQALYLEIDVTDLTFWDPIARRNAAQDKEIGGAEEEEEEEEPSSEERDDPDYVPERETGIASGSSQPRKKNEEEEEQRKRKRQETAEGKRPTTNISPTDPSIGDPWRDPEPPEEEDDGTATEGSRRRKRRSESPASSGSPSRSSIRLHQDLGVQAPSPVVLSPTP
ncbi:hypothetical protein CBR_g3862 [Chara braunii]|uniref:Uncharacterized protein n=1 Tax=Chara braunii TaxID=69332 RepID=A0A388KGI7_CHABU|nr:hypothetical protein CBR_g3862 [Chara braunii]|eukprot:GBG69162.1 hypothetical protein CBR_g3862 [Chara braunii]